LVVVSKFNNIFYELPTTTVCIRGGTPKLEPRRPRSRRQSLDAPSRLFGEGYTGSSGYDLYEEDDEFVLSIDVNGVDREEIDLTWDTGLLNVAAEHVDEDRGRKRTFHRRFRFPKDVDTQAISASYSNGVLEVTLPIREDIELRGEQIPIEG